MAAAAEAKLFGGGAAQNDGGDTFLTDLMMGKKQASEGRRGSAQSAKKPGSARPGRPEHAYSEMDVADIEEELRDQVFDYENSQALVLMADNFLSGNEHPRPSSEAQSQSGYSTNSKLSDTSKIHQNITTAGKHDPFKIKLLQDRLDDKAKARLATMLTEIDDNLDDLMQEKAEYHKQGMKSTKGFDVRSQMSRQTGASRITEGSNAYSYANNDQQQMQELNTALQKFNPGLVGSQVTADNFDTEASVIDSGKK